MTVRESMIFLNGREFIGLKSLARLGGNGARRAAGHGSHPYRIGHCRCLTWKNSR